MTGSPRQLHFNAFLMSSGHHEAAWRLAESDPFANVDLAHWHNLAQLAERAAFDSLFLADNPALWGSPRHRPAAALEPTVLLAALAAVTSRASTPTLRGSTRPTSRAGSSGCAAR
ncbi:MAG: LLM class flavin-dependent oxidoreductase [Streptosporangiaceae bacterium]